MSGRLYGLLAFQVGWLACVIGGAQDRPWLGPVLVLALLLPRLALLGASRTEVAWLLGTAAGGAALEALMVVAGVYALPHGLLAGLLWLGTLWFAFAATLADALRWVALRPVLGALFGLIGGPLSFLAGERLGAITLGEPRALALCVLAAAWAGLVPVVGRLTLRFATGRRARPQA